MAEEPTRKPDSGQTDPDPAAADSGDRKSTTDADEKPRDAAALKVLKGLREAVGHWFASPARRRLTIQLLVFVAFLVALWFLLPNQSSINALVELGKTIGYTGFYLAQSFLPLIGFPVIPFLIIGSFSFEFLPALLGTAVATAIQLPLAYLIGRRVLKGMVHHLSEWFEFPVFKLRNHDKVKFIFFVKLIPGLSQTLRHYILAIYEVPFRQFLIISWSMSMIFSTIILLASKTLMTGGNWNIYLGIACVALIIALIIMLRKQNADTGKNHGQGGDSDSSKTSTIESDESGSGF
jgi:uncharacterized membrane protein YdjX (TVP38/TMEM64 family)